MEATAKRPAATSPDQDGRAAPLLRKSNKIEPMLIDSLRESPWQPRLSIAPNELEDLKKSIRDFGFVGYIPVRKSDPTDPASPLEIVYGHRRVMAARLLGMETIPVMLCQLDDAAMMRLAFVENSTQKKMTYWEEARHFKEMQERLGLSVRKLAEMLGLSRNYVHSRLQLLALPEGSPLRIAAERNDIVMANALAFTNLSRSLDPDQLELLLDDVRKGELNVLDLQGLERALAKAQEIPLGELNDDGAIVRTSSIDDQEAIKAELVEAARRKELHAYQPVFAAPEIDLAPSRIAREAAALETRKLGQQVTSDHPHEAAAVAVDPVPGGDQPAAVDAPTDPAAAASRRGLTRKDGLAYALEAVEQLRGVLLHLRPRVEKADFDRLDPATRQELRAMRDDLSRLLEHA